jgi:organic radical activating enzyme
MNKQAIEKRDHRQDGTLDVHSIFYTIQGEGPFCGTPAVFVRLSGCNLQCPGCDTDYTSKRARMDPLTILTRIAQEHRIAAEKPLVVITGGEPFRQNLSPLLYLLCWNKYFVQIESNGALEPSESGLYSKDIGKRDGVYIVCSPKTGKVHPKMMELACCFKYVLDYRSVSEVDGLPIAVLDHTVKEQVARPLGDAWFRPIYLQPMDYTRIIPSGSTDVDYHNRMALHVVQRSCLKHGYILQLQVHKIIGVE